MKSDYTETLMLEKPGDGGLWQTVPAGLSLSALLTKACHMGMKLSWTLQTSLSTSRIQAIDVS